MSDVTDSLETMAIKEAHHQQARHFHSIMPHLFCKQADGVIVVSDVTPNGIKKTVKDKVLADVATKQCVAATLLVEIVFESGKSAALIYSKEVGGNTYMSTLAISYDSHHRVMLSNSLNLYEGQSINYFGDTVFVNPESAVKETVPA